jgi:predicted short-subunit dehydrogenase-like oxidoreductase (DUF2520 family)
MNRMKRPLKLSIVGAGRVGQTLGRLGREAGYEIVDVVCRSRRSALKAARFIGAGTPQAASSKSLRPADVTFITTPDDRIGEAAQLILDSAQPSDRAAVLHASGAASSDALAALRESGFVAGSCHPLQAFESPQQALSVVRQSYFCIEGDPGALRAARSFVRRIGARSFEIPTDKKPLYHAAAVLAAGGITALLSVSFNALGRCGLSEAQARRVLLPLTKATVANVEAIGPRRALTGPVRRGDVGTVRRNMEALAANDRQWLTIYRLLAAQGLSLIEPQINPDVVDVLQELLKG